MSASVGIIYKQHYEPARVEAENLRNWLEQKGLEVYLEEMGPVPSSEGNFEEWSDIPKHVNWVVVLGGDGTLLGAARRVGRYGVPILGVNLGGLGFLTGIPLERLYPVVETMIQGGLQVEKRGMLETRIFRQSGLSTSTTGPILAFQVLNDVVINKSTLARIIDLNVTINEEFLTTFRADGLIISTPTGSTAYNLAAGGPILYPTIESFILTPICPFTLTNRPLIVPDSVTLGITMGGEREDTVTLTFDGQVGFELQRRDWVEIRKSSKIIKLLRPDDQSYFKILRTKLMWGGTTQRIRD
ncbi:MAG: NAD(+)/NADH kinase [Deltaproteobacteria bacterium]|nr:NAD(+)/NADH kinase [Deltaproteobacteria bacterium]